MSAALELCRRMLAAARTGSVTPVQRRAFNAEAQALGSEAMSAAREQLGEEREAKRQVTRKWDAGRRSS